MNTIKFRAWSHKNTVMRLFDNCKDGIEYVCGTFMVSSGWDSDKSPVYEDPGDWLIMQYTGLKDKNGVEIYEGDLLEESPGHLFEVVWGHVHARCGFTLQWRTKSIQYPEWNRGTKMEVIGNIHENPELLEGK